MQSTIYSPMYYHAMRLNMGASGVSSHLSNNNANGGEERGYNVSFPPCTMNQNSVYDKEIMRQIIANHEATFRYQVSELHRLYQRQKELTDDMRVREIFKRHLSSQSSEPIHCSSQARPYISLTTSQTTSWLLGGDHSHHKLSVPTPEKIKHSPTCVVNPGPLIKTKDAHETESIISCRSKGAEIRILDLELPADVYRASEGDRSEEGNAHASGSVIGSSKANLWIDLNEPVQLESTGSSSGLLNRDMGSDGMNSLVVIDLNSSPVGCSFEAGLDENLSTVKTEFDLNTDIFIDKSSPPTIDLVGPVSPENKEGSPPRGESENTQMSLEPDTIAAQTLVMISYSENSLLQFAKIVSSIGDNLENEIVKLQNLSTDNAQHGRLPNGIYDLREENAVNRSRVFRQEKETGTLSSKSKKSKMGIHKSEILLKTDKLRRNNASKKACGQLRKNPKLTTCSKQTALPSWGTIKKRGGGRRGKASMKCFLFVR